MDQAEILHLMDSPESLKSKVSEASDVIYTCFKLDRNIEMLNPVKSNQLKLN
ncbi:hypothetical protein YC2023_083780 [Brassica napus]